MTAADSSASSDAARFTGRQHRLYINGEWVASRNGDTLPSHNPFDDKLLCHFAAADAADVDRAVASARRAFDEGPWPRMAAQERARLIWRLGDLVEAHADELALLEALDVGKPYGLARRTDIPDSADRFRYFAGWASKTSGDTLDFAGALHRHAFTVREPVGVAGLITAWNFPLFQAANKLGPALAAGCCVVLKPAEQAPLSCVRLVELAHEAGFPPGVINLVTGLGHVAGAAMSAHPGIDKISFTGSTRVGKEVLRAACGNLKRVTLELGGKSPIVILPDADLDRAIASVASSIFLNAGQVCSAGSRLLAHPDILEPVLQGIARYAAALRPGDPCDPDTTLGPLVSKAQLVRVSHYCDSAREAGARIVTGGQRGSGAGCFFEPTVLTDMQPGMPTWREEIFGPVLSAAALTDTSLDAIAREANDTDYGLAAYIWTRDTAQGLALARRIRAGLVNLNGGARDASVPNGGFKQSGWGREHGFAAVEAYTELKSVVVAL